MEDLLASLNTASKSFFKKEKVNNLTEEQIDTIGKLISDSSLRKQFENNNDSLLDFVYDTDLQKLLFERKKNERKHHKKNYSE